MDKLSLLFLICVLPTIAYTIKVEDAVKQLIENFEIQNSSKRCSTVLIGKVEKVSTEYVWEIKGFLDYMEYLRDFDPNFELNSEKVNFSTIPELGGTWTFRIFKEPISAIQQSPSQQQHQQQQGSGGPRKSNGSGGSPSASSASSGSASAESTSFELSIQAVHTWHEVVTESNPPETRGINYKALLQILYANQSVWQESKTTIADIQFKFVSSGSYKHQYIYTFKWRNIQGILQNITKIPVASVVGAVGGEAAGGLATPPPLLNQDIVLHFIMIAHLPSEAKVLSRSCYFNAEDYYLNKKV